MIYVDKAQGISTVNLCEKNTAIPYRVLTSIDSRYQVEENLQ